MNVPWGIDEGWTIGGQVEQGDYILCGAPDSGVPTDPYFVQVWKDWSSEDSLAAYSPGQVVTLVNESFEPIENPTVIFTKP